MATESLKKKKKIRYQRGKNDGKKKKAMVNKKDGVIQVTHLDIKYLR